MMNTWLKEDSNQATTSSAMWPQGQSRLTWKAKASNANFLSRTTTKSTPQNGQSKCLRTTLSQVYVCDREFPSVLWANIIKQTQDTLNMLRISRVHPQLSTYHVLGGQHDFNQILFGPSGTRATIFNPPEIRTS